MKRLILPLILGSLALSFAACGDDDNDILDDIFDDDAGAGDTDAGMNDDEMDSGMASDEMDDAGLNDSGAADSGAEEMTDFDVEIENITPTPTFAASGVFSMPVGSNTAGPLTPGSAYEVTFTAAPGYPARAGDTRLTFASMFVPSNDLFFSPAAAGIDLFDADGTPRTGDVTDEVMVWDAGTEQDEPLNGSSTASPNQKPNQGANEEDVGPADDNEDVRLASVTYPGEIPAIDELIQVTLEAEEVQGATEFTLRIENVSMAGTLGSSGPFDGAVPLSPGVFAVYSYEAADPGPLFTSGEPDRAEGLEDIAEDGVPTQLAMALNLDSGFVAVSSPGVWAVHGKNVVFFTEGEPVGATGLEAIAEDGDPSMFLDTLAGLNGVRSSGQIGNMPLPPGESYTFSISAAPGDVLSLATMFVPSNDILFATEPAGIQLFDSGEPVSGEIADEISLWDVGTEVNQAPGVGLDQVHLQSDVDTGAADPNSDVRPVDDGFNYPEVPEVWRVTITPK